MSREPGQIKDDEIITEAMKLDYEKLSLRDRVIIDNMVLNLKHKFEGNGLGDESDESAAIVLWAIGRLLNDTRGA